MMNKKKCSREASLQATSYKLQARGGFTIIELLVAVSIIAILASVVTVSFSGFFGSQELTLTAGDVSRALYEARSKTLASVDDAQYGVHFEEDRIILFKGESYDAGATDNETRYFDRRVQIDDASELRTGSAVVFARLTGRALPASALTLKSTRSGDTKTVTIYGTGIVEIQ